MEKFENFCLEKSIFAAFAFLVLFLDNFCVFGLNTKFVPLSSVTVHLFHMKVEK
jgi:hypothetical protein